jgi:hypothetical protein
VVELVADKLMVVLLGGWNGGERERERERDSTKREKQGREAGFLAEFEPNLLPIFTEKKFQPLILLVRIPTVDSK